MDRQRSRRAIKAELRARYFSCHVGYQTWQRRRLRMRPGLTCLWALAGRDTLDFDTWMKMDMQYIDTWSLTLDWNILLRTIPRVLTGRGVY